MSSQLYKYQPLERLRAERKLRGLSTRELAEKSGVARQTIEALEYGISNPLEIKLSTLIKLCKALKLKAYDLFPSNELKARR